MLVQLSLLAGLLCRLQPVRGEVCAGCPVAAEVDQKIVDFAMAQLTSVDQDSKCSKSLVKTENFQSQVCAFRFLGLITDLYRLIWLGGGWPPVQVRPGAGARQG